MHANSCRPVLPASDECGLHTSGGFQQFVDYSLGVEHPIGCGTDCSSGQSSEAAQALTEGVVNHETGTKLIMRWRRRHEAGRVLQTTHFIQPGTATAQTNYCGFTPFKIHPGGTRVEYLSRRSVKQYVYSIG